MRYATDRQTDRHRPTDTLIATLCTPTGSTGWGRSNNEVMILSIEHTHQTVSVLSDGSDSDKTEEKLTLI